MRGVERIWYGSDAGARFMRALLAPLAAVYRGVAGIRNGLYDAGILRAGVLSLPAISVGNLTVGGTGKTPITAWLAHGLRQRGARPAVLLRGYGGDEELVHRCLNPDIPVITSGDRLKGAALAERSGANVVILDDAFQHRRVARAHDVVLISADERADAPRLLPAGPYREPPSAARRASLVLVTRKSASRIDAERVAADVRRVAPNVSMAFVHLRLAQLREVNGSGRRPLSWLEGKDVLALAAVGHPRAFETQITAAVESRTEGDSVRGGKDVEVRFFPDHHAYTDLDVEDLVRAAAARIPVCTLKDAVKLAAIWPRAAPALWYVSQQIDVESGGDAIDRLLETIVPALSLIHI